MNFAGKRPEYFSFRASGADLRANIDEAICLVPLQRVLIPTGTYVEIPEGYEGQIRPRSGLSYKHGIIMLNGPGTIDSDYRGEIKIPLVNIGKENYSIAPDERIAQLVICPVLQAKFIEVEDRKMLSDTERSVNGFGSSGKI